MAIRESLGDPTNTSEVDAISARRISHLEFIDPRSVLGAYMA